MYATGRGEGRLTLGVSGMLWKRSLVMYDEETGSLWSHLLGEAMQGKLKGTELEQIPSIMTTWGRWKAAHADGTVAMLKPTSRTFNTKFFRSLDRFVLGIAEGEDAAAWPFDRMAKEPVVHDTWQDDPIVVVFDAPSVTPRMYGRQVDGRTLTFAMTDGRLRDSETKTTWNLVTGRAVDGPLKGKSLVALPAIVSFKAAWRDFHPKSEYR